MADPRRGCGRSKEGLWWIQGGALVDPRRGKPPVGGISLICYVVLATVLPSRRSAHSRQDLAQPLLGNPRSATGSSDLLEQALFTSVADLRGA